MFLIFDVFHVDYYQDRKDDDDFVAPFCLIHYPLPATFLVSVSSWYDCGRVENENYWRVPWFGSHFHDWAACDCQSSYLPLMYVPWNGRGRTCVNIHCNQNHVNIVFFLLLTIVVGNRSVSFCMLTQHSIAIFLSLSWYD